MRLRNPRFLILYEEDNVKIVFSHDPGCRKSTNNPSKIDTKSDADKNACRNHVKSMKNGGWNGSKIDEKRDLIWGRFPQDGQKPARAARGPLPGCPGDRSFY